MWSNVVVPDFRGMLPTPGAPVVVQGTPMQPFSGDDSRLIGWEIVNFPAGGYIPYGSAVSLSNGTAILAADLTKLLGVAMMFDPRAAGGAYTNVQIPREPSQDYRGIDEVAIIRKGVIYAFWAGRKPPVFMSQPLIVLGQGTFTDDPNIGTPVPRGMLLDKPTSNPAVCIVRINLP